MSACVLSWQPLTFDYVGVIIKQLKLQFSLNERFQIYNCRMMINVCISVAFGNYLCLNNQYVYLLLLSLFCL